MAEVAICSLVRNAMTYLPNYRRQLESFTIPPGLSWKLCILEGDSHDDTQQFLRAWAEEDDRIFVGQESVGDACGRTDRAERWARAGNACLDLLHGAGTFTHFMWLEADLCFPPELLHRLVERNVDVVAPVIWCGGSFYDTWGFRGTDGVKWTNEPPYHAAFAAPRLVEMNSVGSCVLFRREIFDAGIRLRGSYDGGLLVGMCNDARAKGFKVFADTATAILHPVDLWEGQMWRCDRVFVITLDGRSIDLGPPQENRIPLFAPEDVQEQWRWLLEAIHQRLECSALRVFASGNPVEKTYVLRIQAEKAANSHDGGPPELKQVVTCSLTSGN